MLYFKRNSFRTVLVPVSLFILVSACSSKEASGKLQDNIPAYKKIAEEKFNNNYIISFNNDSTYLIAYYFPKNIVKKLNPPLIFFVYDTNSKKVIFEDNLTNGKIEWINNRQLKVSTIPEIVTGDDEKNKEMFGYVYDVYTRKKLTKENKNK